MARLTALAPLAALLAGACTVGPNYTAPRPALPESFAEAPPAAPGATSVDLAHWWQAFDDPELARLIALGLANAPDLQTAESRVREARLQIVEARAQGLPQINAQGSGEYIKYKKIGSDSDVPELIQSLTGGSGSGGGSGTTARGASSGSLPFSSFRTFSAGFDASWELDLFGGVRRQVEAARAQAEAAEWNARDARVSLAAEIAADYLQMRGDQQQAAIAQSEAERQARSLAILVHTAQVGLVPQGNAIRQRTQLAQARAQVAPLQAEARSQMHAIAVLIGETPETLIAELFQPRPLPPAPPAVPPGLPVDLIRRRPDVRAAERQLAAANAQIGAAIADMYPKITLTAVPQLGLAWLGSFFLGKSFMLTAQGQASFPILDFGRRRAAVGVRREETEQAYVAWRQAVLGALRDVEDALVRLDAEKSSNADLAGGVTAAKRSLAAVEAQYKVGLSDYTPVLDAQQQVLQAENNLAQSDVRLRQDVASLYKALGGGWSTADAPPAAPDWHPVASKR